MVRARTCNCKSVPKLLLQCWLQLSAHEDFDKWKEMTLSPPTHSGSHLISFFLLWMPAKRWAYHVKRPFKISSITTIGPHLKKTWHNKNKQQISLQLLHLILSELSLIYFIKRSPDSLSKCGQIQCGKL